MFPKKYYKLDDDGFILPPVRVIDKKSIMIYDPASNTEIQNSCYVDPIEFPIPPGMKIIPGVTPKFNQETKIWEEQEIPEESFDLEQGKLEKLVYLTSKQEEMELDKFEWNGNVFSADKKARENMTLLKIVYDRIIELETNHQAWLDGLTTEEKDTLIAGDATALDFPKEVIDYTGRWWFTYGGAGQVFITRDQITDFCFQFGKLTDDSWDVFGPLNAARMVATSKEDLDLIIWPE